MSKQSRRARPGSRPAGEPATPVTPAGGTPRDPAESRPIAGATTRPSSTRVGRRERARPAPKRSFVERFRTPIVAVVVVAAIALIAVFAFSSSGAAAYGCSVQYQAPPAASPGASSAPGFVQDDMGNTHVPPGSEVTYTFCPPATGSHYNVGAPIAPRVYGPGDRAIPQGWIHNLEHGGLVILYRGLAGDEGVTDAAQQTLTTFFNEMPNSPVCGFPPNQQGAGVVIARFDEMATPYAALVWGRILPLETFDAASIMSFWNAYGERTNPEKFCTVPSASPATSPAAS